MPDRYNTKTYRQLEMLIGHDAAEKVVDAYRGQELYVPPPEKINDDHKLVKLLGIDVARRMCYYFQGSPLTLPMQQKKILAKRNSEIISKYTAGTGKGTLATEYGLHVRTVRKIIKNHDNELAKQAYARLQLCLFDC